MKKLLLYTLIVLISLVALTAIFFTARLGIAKAQSEREWQTVPTSVPALATTSHLEIIPLYENDRINESLDFGHGVSYLIRTDSATVILDMGNNPDEAAHLPSLQNLQALDIAWDEIDAVLISHPHPDHVGGVTAWRNKTVSLGDFTGNLGNLTIYTPISMTYPGTTISLSAEPTLTGRDMATTGTIPYPEVFPISLFSAKGYEQGLVIDVAGEGLVLITGCGHPTLEKLVTRAEALYGKEVVGVVGGLHYGEASPEEIQPHIKFLETRHPKLVALSPHDSGQAVIDEFASAFPEAYQYIRVGEAIQFPKNK
jgi:7,8-dihydropterin-6-yl-methyl-4-(beta-D-ribofuranosyl)aminobenzene 5'-phosphate synthase